MSSSTGSVSSSGVSCVFESERYAFLGSPLLCSVANVVEHERHKLGVKWPLERQSDRLSLQLKSFYLTSRCWWDWAVWLVLSPLNQQWAPNCIWFHLQLIQHSGGWSRTRVQRVCKIQLGLNPSVSVSSASRASMCRWKAMKWATRFAASLLNSRRSRQWRWPSPISNLGPNTKPGRGAPSTAEHLNRAGGREEEWVESAWLGGRGGRMKWGGGIKTWEWWRSQRWCILLVCE